MVSAARITRRVLHHMCRNWCCCGKLLLLLTVIAKTGFWAVTQRSYTEPIYATIDIFLT
jgi:hypothetical protein